MRSNQPPIVLRLNKSRGKKTGRTLYNPASEGPQHPSASFGFLAPVLETKSKITQVPSRSLGYPDPAIDTTINKVPQL